MMTYRELMKKMLTLDEARLDDTVTIFDSYEDEYTAVIDAESAVDDVLDKGHMILITRRDTDSCRRGSGDDDISDR